MAVLLFFLMIHPTLVGRQHEDRQRTARKMVRELHLTDICLFTEARYTRHLSQADLHSAFQDLPTSFEHFPSGSLTLPPGVMYKPDR